MAKDPIVEEARSIRKEIERQYPDAASFYQHLARRGDQTGRMRASFDGGAVADERSDPCGDPAEVAVTWTQKERRHVQAEVVPGMCRGNPYDLPAGLFGGSVGPGQ